MLKSKIQLIFLIYELIIPMIILANLTKNCGEDFSHSKKNEGCCSQNCTSIKDHINICSENRTANLVPITYIKEIPCYRGGQVCLRSSSCCSKFCVQPSFNLMGICFGNR